MAWHVLPGTELTVNFEKYSVAGCDVATQRRMQAL